jgi:hypothetical protein
MTLDYLASSGAIQTLRDAYRAEIVVMLTADWYGYVFGIAKKVEGLKSDAFCIIDITEATNSRRTFAHEVSHIFGARHDDDPDPGTAHGRSFVSPACYYCGTRFTLMSQLNLGLSRIDYISNPSIYLGGAATGTATRNNAAKINSMKNYVAAFYNDPPSSLSVDFSYVALGDCVSNGSATAIAKCGRGTYTYKWYTVNYPNPNWVYVGSGTNIQTYVLPISTYNSQPYKVVVTDALGQTATKTKMISSYCPLDHYGTSNPYSAKSVSNSAKENTLTLYPNPATHIVTIKLKTMADDMATIELLDIAGKAITTLFKGAVEKGVTEIPVNLDQHAKGMYFIQVKGNNFKKTEKLSIY